MILGTGGFGQTAGRRSGPQRAKRDGTYAIVHALVYDTPTKKEKKVRIEIRVRKEKEGTLLSFASF